MEIIAWNYEFIWHYVRALCIFGTITVILYWLHLLRSWCSELLRSAGHDNYAGTSHLLRIAKGFGIAPSKSLEWTLCLGVEPAHEAVTDGQQLVVRGAGAVHHPVAGDKRSDG